MSKVDISIIVPIYNAEKYLKKCLDSLKHQTKEELEFILINDGSTDSTAEIIKEYIDSDKRIRYFENKNQGIGKTRNFGITKATGKYIMFLDSDDYIEEDTCRILFEKAEHSKLDIVICDFYKVYSNKENEEIRTKSFKNSSLKDNPEILNEFLCPWAKLYRRDLIEKHEIKFIENLKYEDAPFVAIALDKASKIGKVDECLFAYRIHDNSETTVRDERVFDIITIVDIIRKYFKNKTYIRETLDALTVRILTNYTIQQRMQKDKSLSNHFIDSAFTYLKKEIPDYKNKKYYKNRSLFKRTIEKNKLLTKIYCNNYRK